MLDEYYNELNLDRGHKFEQIDFEWKNKRGEDVDTTIFEEYDKQGQFIRKIKIKDSTSKYPPFSRHISMVEIK